MKAPYQLSAAQAAQLIARGELTAVALVESCLARIAAREAAVGAWEHLDPEQVLAQARECDRVRPLGPLHGIPVGIKDIIDTADMPTGYGYTDLPRLAVRRRRRLRCRPARRRCGHHGQDGHHRAGRLSTGPHSQPA